MAANDYVFEKKAFDDYQKEYQFHQTQFLTTKKKAEFNSLLKRAIHNELSDVDVEILNMYFFKGYTQREIAKVLGVNCSTVSRRINKSLDTLYEKLKYAAEYRFGIIIEKRSVKR